MRINQISSASNLSAYNKNNNIKQSYSNPNNTLKLKQDTVSFKGFGISVSLIAYVAKEGYHALNADKKKARYANELLKKVNSPDFSNYGADAVNTLFALAKTPANDEPVGVIYDWYRDEPSVRLKQMKVKAFELFSKIPELKGDVNHGHAAKLALLSSYIDTGEYAHTSKFFKAFKDLPETFDKDKLFLMKKMLRDKNVKSNAVMVEARRRAEEYDSMYRADDYPWWTIPLTPFFAIPYQALTADRRINKDLKNNYTHYYNNINPNVEIANTALLSTLDFNKYKDFFNEYENVIQQQAYNAFKTIKEDLTSYKNKIFDKYANGFYECDNYKNNIAKQYYTSFMLKYKDSPDELKKEFNIDNEEYFTELNKDFKFLMKLKNITNETELKNLFKQRIDEKFNNTNEDIKYSGKGLLAIANKEDEYSDLLPKKVYPETTVSDYDSSDDLPYWKEAELQTPWIVL